MGAWGFEACVNLFGARGAPEMKHNSPQLGFNNNVRHKGRVFHIQTEDSGVKHPHIITHLFVEGGRILKSQKTSYAEFLGEEELSKKVRSLMQEQHKAMFIALRAGKFDHMFGDAPPESAEGGAAAPAQAAAPAPAPASTPGPTAEGLPRASSVGLPPAPASSPGRDAPSPSARASMPSLVGATEFARSEPPPRPAPASAPATPAKPPSGRAPLDVPAAHADTVAMRAVAEASTPHSSGRPPATRLTPPPPRPPDPPSAPRQEPQRPPTSPGMARLERPGTRAPSVPPPAGAPTRPTPRPPLSASLDLDLEALERAAEQTQAPVYKQIRDLPPPPASLLKPSVPRNTSYRSVTPQATQIVADPKGTTGSPPANRQGTSTIPRAPTSNRGSQRYAPSRPASIFGSSRPQEGSSIFGEDLISEKSLDEVILSYLAEDLDSGSKK